MKDFLCVAGCFIAMSIIIVIAGCATVKVTSHEYCLTYHPIVASKADFLAVPDSIAKQLLGNESTYADLCK